MLNRRILRIKAMQSIYAFKKSQESDVFLAQDQIADRFNEELLKLGIEHKWDLMEKQDVSMALMKDNLKEGTTQKVLGEEPDMVKQTAWEAIVFYRMQVHKDYREETERMVNATEMLFSKYLRVLQLIVTLADRIKKVQRDREASSNTQVMADNARFFDSPLISSLRNHHAIARENFHWNPDLVANWATSLRKSQEFQEALDRPEGDAEDREILLFVLREFIFKNESVMEHFEEADIHWTENKRVLRSMLAKTLKSVESDGTVDVLSLSKNWEDDKDFFLKLFRATIDNEDDWEQRITRRTKKWASDRIATVDKILLEMALSEMVTFPSIPMKVTINEYIEISKSYSTPKSWQFMNGVLDAISTDLKEEGLIRKSGRGLLDNK